ncbi:MAG: hypothetical protein ACH255_21285, partial [Candidatus Thiodiazotropha sp.]
YHILRPQLYDGAAQSLSFYNRIVYLKPMMFCIQAIKCSKCILIKIYILAYSDLLPNISLVGGQS